MDAYKITRLILGQAAVKLISWNSKEVNLLFTVRYIIQVILVVMEIVVLQLYECQSHIYKTI
jgi:hypothetical protein